MESQATYLQAVLIENKLQKTTSNIVWFDNILVNRTGAFEPILGNSCNVGYVVQCDTQGVPVSSYASVLPIILLIPIIIICLMLVFVIISLRKKKRALERELEALKSRSENPTAFHDCTNDGDGA